MHERMIVGLYSATAGPSVSRHTAFACEAYNWQAISWRQAIMNRGIRRRREGGFMTHHQHKDDSPQHLLLDASPQALTLPHLLQTYQLRLFYGDLHNHTGYS